MANDASLNLIITGFKEKATCDYSGKTDVQCVVISSHQANLSDACLCVAELTKILRFLQRQAQKSERNGQHADEFPVAVEQ